MNCQAVTMAQNRLCWTLAAFSGFILVSTCPMEMCSMPSLRHVWLNLNLILIVTSSKALVSSSFLLLLVKHLLLLAWHLLLVACSMPVKVANLDRRAPHEAGSPHPPCFIQSVTLWTWACSRVFPAYPFIPRQYLRSYLNQRAILKRG